jgi:uncharacterized membrane protein
MKPTSDFALNLATPPVIRHIQWHRPFTWLAAGWRDFKANPLPSLAYGLLFSIGGDLIILAAIQQPHLLTAAISGFFLVAPLLAAGLYELSRSTAAGEKIMFIDSLRCFGRHGRQMILFGLLLAAFALFWERISAVAFGLLGATAGLETTEFFKTLLFNGEYHAFVAGWFALGGVIALFVFALAVVSVPMILDRGSDLVTAMSTSLRVFAANPLPVLIWAVLIVLLTLTGFATLLFGLVVLMPLLGHASWHAYRDLVA